MHQTALDRRTFMAFGLAGGLGAIGGFGALAGGPVALKPFAHSRTVLGFARFLLSDATPRTLRETIEAELARTDGTSAIPALEREHAMFFARLAVWNIAPRALRAAGYETLAANCERQTCLSHARRELGRARTAIGWPPARLRDADVPAHAACHDAALTASLVGEEDIGVVVRTGGFCGRTLFIGSMYDKDTDPDRFWKFGAMAINAAIHLGSDRANELLA